MSGAAIGVVGAGAWGTALAQMLASDGAQVLLWAREAGLAEAINRDHCNAEFLPQIGLSAAVRATDGIAELAGLPVVLIATPAQYLGVAVAALGPGPRDLVLCAKGIEARTGRLMAQVCADTAPDASIAVLSGPTFAHEVAAGLPTAVTLACGGGAAQWARLAPAISRPQFRPYYSDDVIGAEIGGAVKNVLAIACGVVAGLELGENARAALIARGYAEMVRFGLAMGARAETLAGLCGLGDLVLTCSSVASRNFALGVALGQGRSTAEALGTKTSVAEGAHTAPVLLALAEARAIPMPIVAAVACLLAGEAAASVIVAELLARPLAAELGSA